MISKHSDRRVDSYHYWWRDQSKLNNQVLYISSGPHWVYKVYESSSGEVRFDKVPNGADNIFFGIDAVLPEWEHSCEAHSIYDLQAFGLSYYTPIGVTAYTKEAQRSFLEIWMLALLGNVRPLPILAAIGDEGSGKSNLIRSIIELLTQGTTITLKHNYVHVLNAMTTSPVVAFDGVDNKSFQRFADTVSAAITGMQYMRRAPYTDLQVVSVPIPVISAVCLSSRTTRFATPSIIDRLIPVLTSRIPDEERRSDAEIKGQVYQSRNDVLTALAAKTVKLLNKTALAPKSLPGRFVDFNRLVWAYDSKNATQYLSALLQAQAWAHSIRTK